MLDKYTIAAAGIITAVLAWYYKEKLVKYLSYSLIRVVDLANPADITQCLQSKSQLIPLYDMIVKATRNEVSPRIREMMDIDSTIAEMQGITTSPSSESDDSSVSLRRRGVSPAKDSSNVQLFYTDDCADWQRLLTKAGDSIVSDDVYVCSLVEDITTADVCVDHHPRRSSLSNASQHNNDKAWLHVPHPMLHLTVTRLSHISCLVSCLEKHRAVAYDRDNPQHTHMLRQLWSHAFPSLPFSPCNDHWSDLGFQGVDPGTDFRGGGVLSLANLLSFVTHHPHTTQQFMRKHREQGIGYFGLAITGINITVTLLALVQSRQLDSFFFTYGVNMTAFDALYTTVFIDLADLWDREAEMRAVNQMDFPLLFKRVIDGIVRRANSHTLKAHPQIS